MENRTLIKIDHFCKHHEVESSFINALQERGLIQLVAVEKEIYIPEEHLPIAEKIIRLHYDLEINLEGIEVVFNLLKQINDLQEELTISKNKLRLLDNY